MVSALCLHFVVKFRNIVWVGKFWSIILGKAGRITCPTYNISNVFEICGKSYAAFLACCCISRVVSVYTEPVDLSLRHMTSIVLTYDEVRELRKLLSLSSKIRLMRFLVTYIFLYACESWTLTEELKRRIQAMEMRCYRKILRISYKDHVTKEEVRAKIHQAIGPHEDLLTIVKRRKQQWYCHVSRSSGLAKTILQGTV